MQSLVLPTLSPSPAAPGKGALREKGQGILQDGWLFFQGTIVTVSPLNHLLSCMSYRFTGQLPDSLGGGHFCGKANEI